MSDFVHEFEITRISAGAKYPDRWRMKYSLAEPYTVRLLFPEHGPEVEWAIDRELLFDGLTRPVGVGDVHVWTSRETYLVSLSTPTMSAVLEADWLNVRAFLAETLVAVPFGSESEHLNLDARLAELLS